MLYLLIGAVGLVLLAVTLLLGDFFDFETPFLSGTAISAALSGFGLVGAIAQDTGASDTVTLAAGLVSGLVLGAVVGLVTAKLRSTPTDETPNATNIIGARGYALGRLSPDAWGEVSLQVAGHTMKLNARCDEAVPAGTPVVVLVSLSGSAVKVAPAT